MHKTSEEGGLVPGRIGDVNALLVAQQYLEAALVGVVGVVEVGGVAARGGHDLGAAAGDQIARSPVDVLPRRPTALLSVTPPGAGLRPAGGAPAPLPRAAACAGQSLRGSSPGVGGSGWVHLVSSS
jgi:hypothetical protein